MEDEANDRNIRRRSGELPIREEISMQRNKTIGQKLLREREEIKKRSLKKRHPEEKSSRLPIAMRSVRPVACPIKSHMASKKGLATSALVPRASDRNPSAGKEKLINSFLRQARKHTWSAQSRT